MVTGDPDLKSPDMNNVFGPQDFPRTSHLSRAYGTHGIRSVVEGVQGTYQGPWGPLTDVRKARNKPGEQKSWDVVFAGRPEFQRLHPIAARGIRACCLL